MVDSSWVRASRTQMPYTIFLTDKAHNAQVPLTAVFDITNNSKYTLTGVENKNDHLIVNLDGGLSLDFLNKEVNEKKTLKQMAAGKSVLI